MITERVESHDEPELVRRAAAGDQAAFGELVRIHRDEVFTLAMRLVTNRDLAADVSQESLLHAWKGLPRFRGEAAFGTWLHRITVNTARTLRRRALRHAAVPLDRVEDRLEDRSSTPEESADRVALRGRLTAALGELRRPQRAVVVLKDVYDWSHEEISDSLGITVTASKVRLHRARKRLREILEEGRT